ncbi:carboxylesterase/lipase family protein [Glycomyces terrestris]|uniref:Carboxylic ester hydrolase n=1 Tax=Glycomyces terrestris TaxID=2493553 RepID=A0A426UYY0_9ACTN|nr:carboxylesterase family protein [Glycomyces terrestris]RRR99788.1 carboxylesterase family protein [Glycomyces terrestris]
MPLPKTARAIAAGVAAAGLAAAAVAFGAGTASAAPAPTLVETDLGALQGATDGAVRSWLGVPYAAPPEGDLRWASPQPAAAWDGVREAVEFGAACSQGVANMPAAPSEEEDCLYLNVYAPDTGADDLPVMVWFHGGGNSYGAGSQYDPSQLVAEGRTVVVTVNYRQGLFGSMANPALDEGGEATSGNYGLEDQQAALRWVRANAAAFGGDDGNVTVFGESGGGYDVCAHLTSPTSAGLFDKAIVQSAPCSSDWAPSREEGRARDTAVAETLCPGLEDLAAVESCLRGLAPEALNDAVAGLFEVQPVEGGPVMPVATADAIAAGDVADVPVLIGINRDEEQLMTGGQEVLTGERITEADYLTALEAFGGDAAAVAAEYPVAEYENPAKALAAVQTDAHWATALSATAAALGEHTDAFVYELAATDTPWFGTFARPEWAVDSYHMVDVAYLFEPDFYEPRTPRQEAVADAMAKAWTTFARTGDPDGRGRWTAGECSARAFTDAGVRRTDFAEVHRLEFWAGLGY